MDLQYRQAPTNRLGARRGGPPAPDQDEQLDNSMVAQQLEMVEQEQEQEQGPFAPTLNALLGAAFGQSLGGLEAETGLDEENEQIGAEAATEGTQMRFGEVPELSDPESMATVGHEVAHALGPKAASDNAVDLPGDKGEEQAEQAGDRFGAWAARGFEGKAPSLKAAAAGDAQTHRKAKTPAFGEVTLKLGSQGSQVSQLQGLLNKTGAKLDVDGDFGLKTEAAVKRFQAAHGLDVDGLVGSHTAAALIAATTVQTPTTTPGSSSGTGLTGSPPLESGAQGSLVKTLQTLLNTYGASLSVDGDFGAKTTSAVKAFQKANGLDADGVVGPKTAAMLTSGSAKKISKTDTNTTTTTVSVGNADPGGKLNSSSVNPTVKKLAEATIKDLQAQGLSPYVVDTFRSVEKQDELYNSHTGVTQVKGGGSWHNYGLAVDIAFWNSKGTGPSWDQPSSSWKALGARGKANGFTRWGGDWGWDQPHLEYHPKWSSGAAYGLIDTYRKGGLSAVWSKVT